jgi:hypothetical protein
MIDSTVYVVTPNAFVAGMLEQRMYSMITDTVSRVLGFDAWVEFVVAGDSLD